MTAACPPDHDLDRLLSDGLSADEESALEAHVSRCAACQSRLDRLTSGLRPLPAGVLENLGREPGEYMASGPGPAAPPASGPRFTPLGLHAEGGLGRVHRARDEQLHRTVALKEIRPERADDPRVRRRFLNEAEITGQLEHPGIVPIYALEHDAAGRPAYAMRFIHGRPLTDAIRAHHRRPTPLGLRELLQRFISVCQTMAYAHAHGVIHRDLKPDNILLGEFSETLVVDWGLAKRLGPGGDAFVVGPVDRSSDAADPPGEPSETILTPSPIEGPDGGAGPLTVAGTVMGTPAYMAPEQARGEPLTPAADVYSLGAVLFSILTGKVPYRGTSAMEILRRVAAGEPPTAAGAPRALNAIYFKAMARDPQARYATAADLAQDVGRWLADEPVGAHPEPWPARAGRWARRHRSLVASLGVAAGLLVVTGAGVAWWQSRLAQERLVERTRNGEQVEALLDRCEAALAADDAAGARLAVGDAEKRAENPGAEHLRGRLARCRTGADLLAELDRIDELRWTTEDGKFQGSGRAVREWPAAFARIGVEPGRLPPAEAARAVADSPVRDRLLAALDLWLVLAPPGDRAGLTSLLKAADPDPFRDAVRDAVRQSDRVALAALAARGDALTQPARFAAALGSIPELPTDRRLAILARAAQDRPRAFAVLMTAGTQYPGGTARTAPDRLSWYRSAVTVRPNSSAAHHNLGNALLDRGDPDAAAAAFRAALTIDPKLTNTHVNLGLALKAKGNVEGAIGAYQAALALDPDDKAAHINFGLALHDRGEFDKAEVEHRAALRTAPNSINALNNLGLTLIQLGKLDEAVTQIRRAIAIDSKQTPPHVNLGEALKRKGDLDGAAVAYREATRLFPNEPGFKQRLAEVERWLKLMPRLDDVAADRVAPATAKEAIEFSDLCRQPFLKRYAAASRLYAWACDRDPNLNKAEATSARYAAARCAALAGCGQGADAPIEAAARTALRRQALGWLTANQAILKRRLITGNAGDLKSVVEHLTACLSEKDLAGVRPGATRDGWSADETAAWDAYWSDVRTLLARANEARPSPPPGR
ncbi:MAG TPA: tetratricopeptide repeat protein [Gemmataceae bacterium]|nr:tetratricopeptide repeat protein [Gemmataceae bacterium]